MIGPHVSKLPDPREHRRQARANNWGAFQSNFGSTQGFDIPREFSSRSDHVEVDPSLWFWHGSYIAGARPSIASRDGCFFYLKQLIRAAGWWKIAGVVIHTGATVGLKGVTVREEMLTFLEKLEPSLRQANTKLIVELGASISQLNSCPQLLARAVKDSDVFGWCLDLHHCYAAGVHWADLHTVVQDSPPTICHCNFPGTVFCSSKDVHGWRTQPSMMKDGKTIQSRSLQDTEALCKKWDETVRLLKSLSIPLIVEGSGFPGNAKEELDFIRGL